MLDLIKALTIFSKYTQTEYPTHCSHDMLTILCTQEVSDEDKEELETLGFFCSNEDDNCWNSFRFGSA